MMAFVGAFSATKAAAESGACGAIVLCAEEFNWFVFVDGAVDFGIKVDDFCHYLENK